MANLSIIGAGGLTGREMIRLLRNHSLFSLVHITSNQLVGRSIKESYPSDQAPDPGLVYKRHEDPIPKDSVVVLATPNEVSLKMAPQLLDAGHKVIDLSGTFRLSDPDEFQSAYKLDPSKRKKMDSVVFGLPELFREKIRSGLFISNPGCYATAGILPLRFLEPYFSEIQGPVIVDAKSGVSGAGGRTEDVGFSFTNTYENFRGYKILSHQHEPEILEFGLGKTKNSGELVFTPHLLPVYRGILATIYITFTQEDIARNALETLKTKFSSEPFLRFRNTPEEIELKNVQMTNFLDLSARTRGRQLVILSAIDNLMKGAAGQALQNLNLMMGFPEAEGLGI